MMYNIITKNNIQFKINSEMHAIPNIELLTHVCNLIIRNIHRIETSYQIETILISSYDTGYMNIYTSKDNSDLICSAGIYNKNLKKFFITLYNADINKHLLLKEVYTIR